MLPGCREGGAAVVTGRGALLTTAAGGGALGAAVVGLEAAQRGAYLVGMHVNAIIKLEKIKSN